VSDAITALMPVRAHDPGYLEAALDSLETQTSPHWRLVVVVEPADLEPMRRTLAGRLGDPRVELIANQGRKLAGAFNTGMRHAETEFTAILLGDDMWAPDAVEVLERNLREHPQADFFHSSRRFVDDQGNALGDIVPARAEVSLDDFTVMAPVKHLLCWRRELALEFGGMDESLNSVGPDDFDFPWTMAEHEARFVAVPECLYVYRDHRRCFRLTTHLPRRTHERELRRIMRKHRVSEPVIRSRIAAARRTYLRQCLYGSRSEAWLRRRLGSRPQTGWRDGYA
jgi:glycosyltransferase involved in cell wall biosynthesis